MKKLLVGFAAVPFLAGVAMAGQPMPLSDAQMDQVTAGVEFNLYNGAVTANEANQYLEVTYSGNAITLQFGLHDTPAISEVEGPQGAEFIRAINPFVAGLGS